MPRIQWTTERLTTLRNCIAANMSRRQTARVMGLKPAMLGRKAAELNLKFTGGTGGSRKHLPGCKCVACDPTARRGPYKKGVAQHIREAAEADIARCVEQQPMDDEGIRRYLANIDKRKGTR